MVLPIDVQGKFLEHDNLSKATSVSLNIEKKIKVRSDVYSEADTLNQIIEPLDYCDNAPIENVI